MIKFNLKALLKEKGITMTELHEKTGITQNALSLIANGKSNGIQFNTLEKIVTALNCSLDDLITIKSAPYEISTKFLKIENGIYTFSLIGVTEEGINSEVTYGFEVVTSKAKNRTLLQILYFGKNQTDIDKTNDKLFIDSIYDFSNTTLNHELLKVYAYLITDQILEIINEPYIDVTNIITFNWYGLVHKSNDGTLGIHLESKGNDAFPGTNTEATAKVALNKLSSIENVISVNETNDEHIITMHLE